MIVNAALQGAFAALLVAVAGMSLRHEGRIILAVFTALTLMLPIGWENTLAGFQSQVYFALIFSTIAVAVLARAPAFSLAWWGGLAACLLAYFSMASGALAAVAASAITACQILMRQRQGPREIAGMMLIVIVSALMIFWIQTVPYHQDLKAQHVGQFFSGVIILASWPLPSRFGFLIVQLPLLVFACRCLARRAPMHDSCWPVVWLGVFLALEAASLAYGRAGSLTPSRNLDMIMVGLPLNLAALLSMLQRSPPNSAGRRIFLGFAAVWIGSVALALAHVTVATFLPQAADRGRLTNIETQNMIAYLAGDQSALRDKPLLQIPHADPARLEMILGDPVIREILPHELRPQSAEGSQIRNQMILRGKLSNFTAHAESFLLPRGHIFMALGLAGFFISCALTRFGQSARSR